MRLPLPDLWLFLCLGPRKPLPVSWGQTGLNWESACHIPSLDIQGKAAVAGGDTKMFSEQQKRQLFFQKNSLSSCNWTKQRFSCIQQQKPNSWARCWCKRKGSIQAPYNLGQWWSAVSETISVFFAQEGGSYKDRGGGGIAFLPLFNSYF